MIQCINYLEVPHGVDKFHADTFLLVQFMKLLVEGWVVWLRNLTTS